MSRRAGGQYASDIRTTTSVFKLNTEYQTGLFLLQVTEIPFQPGLNKCSEEDIYWLTRAESLGRVGPLGWAAFQFHTVSSELAFSLLFPIWHSDFIYSPI